MGCREQEAPVGLNLACLLPSPEMTAGCLPAGVGNAEGMSKRGGRRPWRLDLVERIDKQEIIEAGHLPQCSASQPPSRQASDSYPTLISAPLRFWDPASHLQLFPSASLFWRGELWSSLEQPFVSDPFDTHFCAWGYQGTVPPPAQVHPCQGPRTVQL